MQFYLNFIPCDVGVVILRIKHLHKLVVPNLRNIITITPLQSAGTALKLAKTCFNYWGISLDSKCQIIIIASKAFTTGGLVRTERQTGCSNVQCGGQTCQLVIY